MCVYVQNALVYIIIPIFFFLYSLQHGWCAFLHMFLVKCREKEATKKGAEKLKMQ